MKDIFLQKYGAFSGKDWLRRLPPEERLLFSDLGRQATDYPMLAQAGGAARAATAKRDARGRFVRNSDGLNKASENLTAITEWGETAVPQDYRFAGWDERHGAA